MEKKYESYTYSELVTEFITITEKTEIVKKDLILEMAKRKELEGVEKKKIAMIIIGDLKDLVSPTYIRNVLGNEQKETIKQPGKTKKEILAVAGGGQEMAPPEQENTDIINNFKENGSQVITNDERVITNHEDVATDLITSDDIIDQRPQEQKEADDVEEDIDKIHLIRELKVENNNLSQQISDLEKLRTENTQLRTTIAELESENSGLYNRIKELEEENQKLKQENRALRNPTPISQPPAEITSRFSSKSHDNYHKNKYYKMTGKK